MVRKAEEAKIKALLKDTITLLCKNGLSFRAEFCIEALIGITLDQDNVVLVSINETIKSELAASPDKQRVKEWGADNASDAPEDEENSDGAFERPKGITDGGGGDARYASHQPMRRKRGLAQPKMEFNDEVEDLDNATANQEDSWEAEQGFRSSSMIADSESNSRFSALSNDVPGLKRRRTDNSDPQTSLGDVGTPVVIKDEVTDDDDDNDWSSCAEPTPGVSQNPRILPPFTLTNEANLYNRDEYLSQAIGAFANKTGSMPQVQAWAHEVDGTRLSVDGGGADDGTKRNLLGQAGDEGTEEASWLRDGRSAPAGAEWLAHTNATVWRAGARGSYIAGCPICNKGFCSKASLMRHNRIIHKGIYPCVCRVCGKGFSSTTHLRGHMVHHTSVREHVCDLCGKEYVYRQDLGKHMRQHAVAEERRLADASWQATPPGGETRHLANNDELESSPTGDGAPDPAGPLAGNSETNRSPPPSDVAEDAS